MHSPDIFHWNDIVEEIIEVSKWPKSYSVSPDFIPLIFIKNVVHYIAYPLESIGCFKKNVYTI